MATINGSTTSNNWTYKLEVSETSYSIANNTSVVSVTAYLGRSSSQSYIGGTWSGSITVDGSTQSMSGTIPYPTYINAGSWYTLATKTFTVSHNLDGSKTASVSSSWAPESGVVPSSASANGSIKLTTIPRASSVSGGSGNIGENTTINISRYSSSFTHTLTYTFGSLTGTVVEKTSSTSINWTIPTSFYAIIPNSNSGTGTITCTTYNGNTNIGTNTCNFTAKVINSNPVFNNFDYIDIGGMTPIGTITTDLTGNENTIIKGYNKLAVTIEELATAQNSATMSYYQVDDVKETPTGTELIFTLLVDNYSKEAITCLAVDSRGNSTAVTKTIANFIDYDEPIKKSFSLTRSDNGVGEFVNLSFSGTFWNGNFGAVENDLTVSYKYKKTNDTTYTIGTTSIIPTINENSFNFNNLIAGDTEQNGFDINESYDIIVEVQDKINKLIYEGIIGTGIPAIAIYKNKVSLGDKYDTSLGGIQLWGDVYINGTKIS